MHKRGVRRLARVSGLVALGAVLAGCGSGAASDGVSAAAVQNGPIVFSADGTEQRDGDQGIGLYVINPDGSGRTRLSAGAGQDHDPAFSPDGRQIAFSGERDDSDDLWVMNADGSGVRRVTTEGGQGPAFSPDGTRIAYTGVAKSASGEERLGLHLVNADGTGRVNLTKGAKDAGPDFYPVFSPDGKRIAFIRFSEDMSSGDVYVLNVDGTGLTRLTKDGTALTGPSFSPDGTRIVFSSEQGASTVNVMNVDGSGLARFATAGVTDAGNPVFSPDGAKIAFAAVDRGTSAMDVYVMNADGTGQARVTAGEESINGLDWAPAAQS